MKINVPLSQKEVDVWKIEFLDDTYNFGINYCYLHDGGPILEGEGDLDKSQWIISMPMSCEFVELVMSITNSDSNNTHQFYLKLNNNKNLAASYVGENVEYEFIFTILKTDSINNYNYLKLIEG